MKAARRWPLQLFRLFSLVGPPLLAMTSSKAGGAFDGAWKLALAPLWLAVLLAVVFRTAAALVDAQERSGALERFDVLTSAGVATAWLGSGALWMATGVGWASLSVVGVTALGVLYLAVLWTCVRAGGADPWRRASFTRSFVPETVVEGDALREEVRFVAPRIPAGFRLLASGRVGRRWPLVRHSLESDDCGGEVILASEVGPAKRGDHRAEPFHVWLEDVLGLCHSVRVRVGGGTPLRVLPTVPSVTNVQPFFARGGHDLDARPAPRLPTEGAMHLREYVPGDDARRIHWVRSLTAGEIVVRLPDEVPRDRPSIEVALDTFFPGAEDFTCDGPAELLDAMVRVWLGVARTLREQGARVTMVFAGDGGDGRVVRLAEPLVGRSTQTALAFGARVAWQGELRPQGILVEKRSVVVSCKPLWECLGHLPGDAPDRARVVVVEPRFWAPFEHESPYALPLSALLFPFPAGTPDNRRSRRRASKRASDRALRDHAVFLQLAAAGGGRETSSSSHGTPVTMARPAGPNTVRLEVCK